MTAHRFMHAEQASRTTPLSLAEQLQYKAAQPHAHNKKNTRNMAQHDVGIMPPLSQPSLMSEINMTPLIDVMLVLLIVFMVTLPIITHTIKVDLPRAESQASATPNDVINLSVNVKGELFWNQVAIDNTSLAQKMTEAAARQASLYIHADRLVPYEHVAQVIATAQHHGITKLGFITQPSDTPSNTEKSTKK